MVFHELQLHDFLSFRGTNTMGFPDPDRTEHSLTLVLAPNNAGKSNIIRALRFFFLGDLLNCTSDPHKLVNISARNDALPDSDVLAWVQVRARLGSELKTIQRRIECHKYKNGEVKSLHVRLGEILEKGGRDPFREDEGSIQRKLELMVPRSLFDYFFFEGETLAHALLDSRRNDGIKEGLTTLLMEREWREAAAHVDRVAAKLSLEIQKHAFANEQYVNKVQALAGIEARFRKKQETLAESRDVQTRARRTYEDCEREILELSKGQSHDDINQRLAKVREEKRIAEKSIEDHDRDICRLVGVSHGVPFLTDAYAPAARVLKQMREDNLLPADVSEGFVNRLLDWPRSRTCICGRPLHPEENATERSCIEEYRNRALAVDLNAALLSLLNSLEPQNECGFRKRTAMCQAQIAAKMKARKTAIEKVQELRQQVIDLEDKRLQLNVEAITHLQERQREAAAAGRQAADAERQIEAEITQYGRHMEEMRAEIRELERKGTNHKAGQLARAIETANELSGFIGHALRVVKESFHHRLQALVGQHYDSVATDGSRAWVDPESLVPAIQRDGVVMRNVGGAQKQLLVLSHIVSLAQLRKALHDELLSLNIYIGQLGDQAFFLDSVFGQTADNYREACAKFLPGKARQVVVLVANQQWDTSIREALEPHADRAFYLELHTPKPVDRPAERTMVFRGRDYQVFKRIADDETAYAQLREIPL